MTSSSSVASSGAGLDRGRDERGGLAPDHVEVGLDRHELVGLARRDVDVLALAQGEARLVVQAHEAQDLGVREPEVGQPMEGDARQAEQRVAGVDRLRHAVHRPQRRPVAPLAVAVLDVVVDEAEVVAELDRRGAGQGLAVVAGDRGVGEQAEEGPHALAAAGARAVEREVVADHLVQPVGRRDRGRATRRTISPSVSAMSSARSRSGSGGGHRRGECTRNVFAAGSLIGWRSGLPVARHDGSDAGAGDASAPASDGGTPRRRPDG